MRWKRLERIMRPPSFNGERITYSRWKGALVRFRVRFRTQMVIHSLQAEGDPPAKQSQEITKSE